MSVDSATSPSASRRMTGGREAWCEDGRFGIRETNQKGVWHYGISFIIDARYIAFCWFICWGLVYKLTICANLSGSHRAFCRYNLEWTGFFIHSAFSLLHHSATSLTGHSARRACPELQNPHFKKQRKTFSFGKKKSGRADERGLIRTCPRPSSSTFPPLLEGLSFSCLWILRLRLRLRAEWQGVGSILWRWKVWD